MWQSNNEASFKKLIDEAYTQITTGNIDSNRPFIFHVHQRPAFGNLTSWTVFDTHSQLHRINKSKRQVHVRRVIWQKDIDLQRSSDTAPWLFSPKPTYEVVEVEVEHTAYDEIVEEGYKIHIPMMHSQGPFGLDGISYGYKSIGCRLDWWLEGPDEWLPFTTWVIRFIRFLDSAVDNSLA